MRLGTIVVATAAAGALITGVVIGATVFSAVPTAAGNSNAALAASGASPSPSPGARKFTSNEDPAHEKGESAQREAEETSGQFRGGAFKPNEDPTHEKNESAPREAQENSGKAPSTP